MRAGSGFHADDLLGFQNAVEFALHVLGVLGGDHVVGDDEGFDAPADEDGRHRLDDRRLAGTDRPAYANASDFFHCLFSFGSMP